MMWCYGKVLNDRVVWCWYHPKVFYFYSSTKCITHFILHYSKNFCQIITVDNYITTGSYTNLNNTKSTCNFVVWDVTTARHRIYRNYCIYRSLSGFLMWRQYFATSFICVSSLLNISWWHLSVQGTFRSREGAKCQLWHKKIALMHSFWVWTQKEEFRLNHAKEARHQKYNSIHSFSLFLAPAFEYQTSKSAPLNCL